ncbi:hypothetical protein LDY14_03015 [Acinetobacter baumannii]|uniref:hypothetical protein n=1 Tax=Acinetobacter baumannii TaxID=470 RepID=UPI001CDB9BBC|nr:hypothetical protein [Acinetobacter baumannii]MCA4179487.1 hypothetical protein [Acinetobacter baumannii]
MDNYKIKVKDEASADEARDLFKKLGYHPDNSSYEPYVEWVAVFEDGSGSFYSHNMNLNECVEITIAQLRDLVVLNRNDVKDATHQDKYDASLKYVYLNGEWYEWINGWMSGCINPAKLTPITQPQDPALISGADALRALADGVKPEEIEGKYSTGLETYFLPMGGKVDVFLKYLNEKMFRLKPQTVKVELELPKPFEPEEDCHVYILDDGKTDGYRRYSYEVHGDKGNTFIGIWRTEEEIKQVVAQLRKIRGTNS